MAEGEPELRQRSSWLAVWEQLKITDNMAELNEEGEVARFSFDDTTIDHPLATESVAGSGAACLYLARQHHEAILG